MPEPTSTKINGNVFDASSVTITVAGLVLTNITEIEWEETLEPGHRRGLSSKKTGRTRGEYDANAKITMDVSSWQLLRVELDDGWGERSFQVAIVIEEADENPEVIQLQGCRIMKYSNSVSQGSDNLQVELELDVMEILQNYYRMALK